MEATRRHAVGGLRLAVVTVAVALCWGGGRASAQSHAKGKLSKKQTTLLTHRSGFLGQDYRLLRPDPSSKDWLIYLRNRDELRHSSTFLVEPVKVYLTREAKEKDVDPADLAKLAEYFTKAMRDELEAGHYRVVTKAGPGVKVLRFAITDVEPNGGKTNMAISGTEAVATHAVMPGVGMLIPRIKVGKVSVEGKMTDAETGNLDMAFMTSKSGRRVFSGLKAFEKWGDIDAAFRSWAKNFRKRLDKARGM